MRDRNEALTVPAPVSIMAAVSVPGAVRRFVGCLAVLGIVSLPLLPSEHVHADAHHSDGHTSGIHRHFEPHHPGDAGTGVEHHEEGEARWLASVFITPEPPSLADSSGQFVAGSIPILTSPQTSRGAPPPIQVSVHDPPWMLAHGLRAPPPLLS